MNLPTKARTQFKSLSRYDMSPNEFLQSICNQLTVPKMNVQNQRKIPGRDDADRVLTEAQYKELSDYIEILTIGIENDPLYNTGLPVNFFKGEQLVTWQMIADSIDLPRSDYTHKNAEVIRDNLTHGRRSILNLKYEPGVGGTTYLRRLAFAMHNEFPTILMHRYIPSYTIDALRKVYDHCQMPILIASDSNEVTIDNISALRQELRDSILPYTIIYAVRNNTNVHQDLILPRLSKNKGEVMSMYEKLEPYIHDTTEGNETKGKTYEVYRARRRQWRALRRSCSACLRFQKISWSRPVCC